MCRRVWARIHLPAELYRYYYLDQNLLAGVMPLGENLAMRVRTKPHHPVSGTRYLCPAACDQIKPTAGKKTFFFRSHLEIELPDAEWSCRRLFYIAVQRTSLNTRTLTADDCQAIVTERAVIVLENT